MPRPVRMNVFMMVPSPADTSFFSEMYGGVHLSGLEVAGRKLDLAVTLRYPPDRL